MSNPPFFFLDFLGFFLFPLRSIFVFFRLDFFTITDFGDDGSVADGGSKSACKILLGLQAGMRIFLDLFWFFLLFFWFNFWFF